MKRLKVFIGAIALIGLFGGCSFIGGLLGPPAIEFVGSALKVDSDGHFEEDIVYQLGSMTYTFASDGTFEMEYEEYEGTGEDWDGDGNVGEGWVVTDAERYDYTVDPDNLTATFDYTNYYDGTQWQPGSYDYEWTENAYFAESKCEFGILVADPDADNTFVTTYSEVDDGWEYSETMTYVYDPDAGTWSYAYHGEYYDDTGAKVDEDEEEASGTFTMLPEGVKFRRGETITIRAVLDDSRYRDWDEGAGWDTWTISGDESVDMIVITHMGDFLIQDGAMSYRSVVGRMAE